MTQAEAKVFSQIMDRPDPLLWLVKKFIVKFLPIVTDIINTERCPNGTKQAIRKPLLKKLDLALMMKNYKPVPNSPSR